MLQHIVANTPIYVWAILAFLLYRGVLAARDREITVTRMTIVPVLMLVLALQSIAMRFGLGSPAMAAWLLGAAAIGLQRWRFGASRVTGGASGTLRIRGSWTPLAAMLAIFVLKYALAVLQAVQPQLAAGAAFVLPACGLLGLCNGYFLGQLACDVAAARRAAAAPALAQAPVPAKMG